MNYIQRAKIAQKFLVEHGNPDAIAVTLYGRTDSIDIQTREPLPGVTYKETEIEGGTSHSSHAVRDGVGIRLSVFTHKPAVVAA